MKIIRQGDPYVGRNGKRTHDLRRSHAPTGTESWIGVDGEGMTMPDGTHGYVLLGVGDDQIENPYGLHWREILSFLESLHKPRQAFVGFYLGYDFTQWLKTLPESRARKLLTIEGKESRRTKSRNLHNIILPVDVDEWQIDALGSRMFKFRRHECRCETFTCKHPKGRWVYVCDAGPFFQTSLLNVINPANWSHPIVTEEEYKTVKRGKDARAVAVLDDDMRIYNRLENNILSRVLRDLDSGFKQLGVSLPPKDWYGPGRAAQVWAKGRAPTRKTLIETVPEWFLEAARQSYFGGWFELACHGIIPGDSHEYDINSAYPYIISRLPCLLHGTYSRGSGTPPKDGLTLVRALVWTRPPHSDNRIDYLGAMLHRNDEGMICRPLVTAGWYWKHELDAAQRAGLVTRITKDRYYEWVNYKPCDCKPPLAEVAELYALRLEVGKNTSLGKAIKLVINSLYGKTAQSVGTPLFGNPVYASLITAGCRAMILDAIATHPDKARSVAMVATDGVFFLTQHPSLPLSSALGEWEHKTRRNLTLFKPGVYWDDEARDRLRNHELPQFKARGISARDFAHSISEIDEHFASWGDNPPVIDYAFMSEQEAAAFGETYWPRVTFKSSFAMTTALQALIRNDWASAGKVESGKELVQSANPKDKRNSLWMDESGGRRIYRSQPLPTGSNARWNHMGNIPEWPQIPQETFDSVPYEKRFGLEDPFSEETTTAFGITPDEHQPFIGMFRLLTGAE